MTWCTVVYSGSFCWDRFGQIVSPCHATLNIPSPPSRYIYSSAQRNILVGAEQVARESMDRARMELECSYL